MQPPDASFGAILLPTLLSAVAMDSKSISAFASAEYQLSSSAYLLSGVFPDASMPFNVITMVSRVRSHC
jgi:hypothetical protein